ncbi:MAG TPA: sigma-70 family RNA polymerase sigma factor [Blastocatellia bacterium]|nr:sigma-70 family RNA polymerase sigma factor [Blastocatellia bacterium]
MTGIRILQRQPATRDAGPEADGSGMDEIPAAGADPGALTDDSLVAAAGSGDGLAFEQLFERHKRRVARLAGRFFTESSGVEEIVQEVFVKVYFALGDYRPDDAASFSAWVNRITINACYDQLRKRKRRPEGSIVSDDFELAEMRVRLRGETGDAENTLIARDLATKLLARIKPDDRVVLTLLDGEEMPVGEIARVMGWTSSKVKVRAHRARAALRRVLSEFL